MATKHAAPVSPDLHAIKKQKVSSPVKPSTSNASPATSNAISAAATSNGSTPSILPKKIEYCVLYSNDVSKSRDYYKEIFGLTEGFATPDFTELKFPCSTNHSTVLAIHSLKETSETQGTVMMNVFVKDIRKYHEFLTSKEGTKVIEEPTEQSWGGIHAKYAGPDGCTFSVLEEPPAKPQGNGWCHLEIPVGNMERAIKFYKETFAWKVTQMDYPGYAIFESCDMKYPLAGGLDLQTDESRRWTFPFIYIHTPDLDGAAEKIKANGGAVVKDKYLMPGIGYAAHVKDTEGNQFFLYREL